MKFLKEWGWVAALVLIGYVTYLTVMPYKRAIEGHEASLQQWGQCIKVNPDKTLEWACETKAPQVAPPVPAPKK